MKLHPCASSLTSTYISCFVSGMANKIYGLGNMTLKIMDNFSDNILEYPWCLSIVVKLIHQFNIKKKWSRSTRK